MTKLYHYHTATLMPLLPSSLRLQTSSTKPNALALSGGTTAAGGGGPIQSLEKLGGNLCASLDNLSAQLNIASQTLNSFIDSVECLRFGEGPVVLMKKEPGKRDAGSCASSEEDRDRAAPDMSDSMHPHGHGELVDKVKEG